MDGPVWQVVAVYPNWNAYQWIPWRHRRDAAQTTPGQHIVTVQPFTMVSGKQVCRYQDMSKESQTRGHSVRIVWQIEAQKKCAFVSVVSVQAKPRQKGQQCRSHYGGKAGKLVDRVVQVSNLELAQN